MAVELPTEIFYDILLRLDVLELCKFRCVSKSWNFFISDPSFVKSHIQRSMKKNNLLVIKRGRKLLNNPSGPLDSESLMRLMRLLRYDDEPICDIKPEFPKYLCRFMSKRPFNQDNFSTRAGGVFMLRQYQKQFYIEGSGFRIISCCGGLVLLSRCFPRTTELRLMNPVSGRINELPIISEPYAHDGFQYRRSCYHLVYSNSGMECKVVRFFPAKDGYGCDVLVLSDSPKWTRVHDANLPTVWFNGTTAGGSLFLETNEGLILKFDIESNKVSLVNSPPGWMIRHETFIEINGELGMSNPKNTSKTKVMEIWILKNKENSFWVNTYSIKIRDQPNQY